MLDRSEPTAWTRRRTVLGSIGAGAGIAVAGCIGGSSGGSPSPVLSLSADTGVSTDSDGRVETWADQSGNGYDFSPPRPEARPGLTEDAASGNSALTFDGTSQFLLREDTLGIPNDSARTVVVVSRLEEVAARSPVFFQGKLNASGGESNAYGLEANTYNTAGERFGVYLVSVANDSERETDTTYHIHTLRTESFPTLEEIRNTTTYYVDGTETAFSHTGGGTFNSPFEGNASAIGAGTKEEPATIHSGEIAAIRVYDTALSSSDRESVEGDLADTYDISLS